MRVVMCWWWSLGAVLVADSSAFYVTVTLILINQLPLTWPTGVCDASL